MLSCRRTIVVIPTVKDRPGNEQSYTTVQHPHTGWSVLLLSFRSCYSLVGACMHLALE